VKYASGLIPFFNFYGEVANDFGIYPASLSVGYKEIYSFFLSFSLSSSHLSRSMASLKGNGLFLFRSMIAVNFILSLIANDISICTEFPLCVDLIEMLCIHF